jgi:hypothetical protein
MCAYCDTYSDMSIFNHLKYVVDIGPHTYHHHITEYHYMHNYARYPGVRPCMANLNYNLTLPYGWNPFIQTLLQIDITMITLIIAHHPIRPTRLGPLIAYACFTCFLVIFLVCVPLLVDARQRRLEDVERTRWNLTRIRISE